MAWNATSNEKSVCSGHTIIAAVSVNAKARFVTTTIAVLTAALAATLANTATADQPCEPEWQAFTSGREIGMSGIVSALTVWSGDLVAGGTFATAGGQTVNSIARWDGSEWHPFTSGGQIGTFSQVNALTVWNGDLIAAGTFTHAGGQNVNRITRWDGVEWHPLISDGHIGIGNMFQSSWVYALTVYNGDLIVGGQFTTAGGQTLNHIARWDGTAWHPFTSGGQVGMGFAFGGVNSLTVWNGDLIAGGNFPTAGGQTVNKLARWDGTQWHPFIAGGETGVNFSESSLASVRSLTVFNGDLIAGGRFDTAGGQTVNNIARWDGTEWHTLTSGDQIGVEAAGLNVFALLANGSSLFVGGSFTTAGGGTVNHIARWNGWRWSPFIVECDLVGLSDPVNALTVFDGDVIAGGSFEAAGEQTVNRIAAWQACPFRGACCVSGVAVQLFTDECAALGGVFQGEEVSAYDAECDPVSQPCIGDLNLDGVIDGFDLLQLLGNWGPCP